MSFYRSVVSFLFILLLSGCAAYWETALRPELKTTDGMYLVPNMYLPREDVGVLFLTNHPEELENYHGVLLDELRFEYADQTKPLRPIDEDWLRESIQRRLARSFSKAGQWRIVDTPGPDVLRARLHLSEIKYDHHRYMGSSESIGYTGSSDSGTLTITLELRDSESLRRLAIFSQGRSLPVGVYWGPGYVQHVRVERAFYDFSLDMRHVIAAAKTGSLPGPDERPPSPCKYSPFPTCR